MGSGLRYPGVPANPEKCKQTLLKFSTSNVKTGGQVWTSLDKFGHVWTSLDKSGQV